MFEDDEAEEEKVDRKSLSQVPSWLMVGFLAGVITMWLFRSPAPESPVAPLPVDPPVPVAVESVPVEETAAQEASLAFAEAIFDTFRDWVFWTDDKTQIALWNTGSMSFSDRFEVIRTLEGDYFRSISEFTRLPLPGYGPPNSPILFTETTEQRYKREISLNPDALPKREKPAPVELNSLPPPPGG
ncbi:MAG: hypothetical protein HOH58_17170 [Opitutaceae bacterium]|jgi:hypothetical protein|nr:hypothetical protein [Opitutaceae bacterium]